MKEGWICPVCEIGLAPHVKICPVCDKRYKNGEKVEVLTKDEFFKVLKIVTKPIITPYPTTTDTDTISTDLNPTVITNNADDKWYPVVSSNSFEWNNANNTWSTTDEN